MELIRMKKILMPLLVIILSISSVVGVISPVQAQAQPSPPQSPEASWQPPDEGGEMAPPVGVEQYGQTWSNLKVQQPMTVAPGLSSSIVDAYLVNGYGQLLTTLRPSEVCYLVVSFNGPGYFYLWEYYPSGSTPYGHWLCYRWYRPYAGVWKIGPFAAESFDPSGRYIWKLWLLSGASWAARTLSFNYISGYPPDIPVIIPAPVPTPSPITSPVINSFSADKSSLDVGETATLTWNTTNANSVTLSPGVGTVAASGSTTVTPAATTIYTLTASGQSGSKVSSTTIITVMPRISPTINTGQATIQKGQATSLSWNAPAALRVYISGVGDVGVKGTTQVAPDKTASYTLTATYVDGTTQSTSVTVNVEQPPYMLWGLLALLAAAAIVIVILLLRKPKAAYPAGVAATQAGDTTPAEATLPTDTLPATTPVIETASAKLAMPDGSDILLASNTRSFGRHDFEKSMPHDNVSYISRQHFNIWYENDQYYIEDRSSTNSTKVNGADIKGTGRHALADGDVIELAGKLSITFKG